jgi:hypothetical protein
MTKRKATAATVAHLNEAHSWQSARPFFKPSRRGAQIHAGHLSHLCACARLCAGWVSDAEAQALLRDVADDCALVLDLALRANSERRQ